ncbi:hypothetical protein ACS0TY_023362 [Phlomoides rotata]
MDFCGSASRPSQPHLNGARFDRPLLDISLAKTISNSFTHRSTPISLTTPTCAISSASMSVRNALSLMYYSTFTRSQPPARSVPSSNLIGRMLI